MVNTPKSLLLTTPISKNHWRWQSCPFLLENYAYSLPALRSTKTTREIMERPPIFEEMAQKPEIFQKFQSAMTSFSIFNMPHILESVDLVNSNSVFDVGGADGTLVLELVKKYHHIKGGVLDRPEVTQMAQNNINSQGLSERVQFHAGNFLESIPSGYDCIVLKHTIHNWVDENVVQILANCRKILQPGNKLFIIDPVINQTSEFYNATLALDHLMMMMILNAQNRTLPEYEKLLNQSGFKLLHLKPCGFESIIEAEAIN